jgi:phage shock protein A
VISKGVVALVAVVLTVSGCRPSAPSESGWQSSAEQAVTDMVSEVATSRLTVEQELGDRFVGHYAVVVLTYAEEAAGSAADTVTTLQPPPSARPGYDELTGLLSDSADAISQARIAVAAGDEDKSREAVDELTRTLSKLHRVEHRLRALQ